MREPRAEAAARRLPPEAAARPATAPAPLPPPHGTGPPSATASSLRLRIPDGPAPALTADPEAPPPDAPRSAAPPRSQGSRHRTTVARVAAASPPGPGARTLHQ